MSTPGTVLEAQLASLLELVEHHRQERCQELTEQADRQAAAIIAQAHKAARGRMHEAVLQERLRAETQLRSTRAHLQTRQRQRHQQAVIVMLQQGWEALQVAMNQRWQHKAHRAAWMERLVREALERLPSRPWYVEHPPGWSSLELAHLEGTIRDYTGSAPEYVASEDITAGLRLHANGACLDGTLEGLLRDRSAIEGELLAEMNN